MHICLHLDEVIIPWESINGADFVAQSFFGFYATIRVFREFDGLSSISGSKVTAKQAEISYGNPLKLLSIFLNKFGSSGHNFGTRNARKSIKGSKYSYSSLESNQILSHSFGSSSGQ